MASPVTTRSQERFLWGLIALGGVVVTAFWALSPFVVSMSGLGALAWETFAIFLLVCTVFVILTRVRIPSEASTGRRIHLEWVTDGPEIRVDLRRTPQWAAALLCLVALGFAVEAIVASIDAGHLGVAVVVGILGAVRGLISPLYVALGVRTFRYERAGTTRTVDWSDISSVTELRQE